MRQALAWMAMGFAAIVAAGVAPAQEAQSISREDSMRIRIIVDDTELAATLEDTAAARDFAALLPLDLTLEDYHGIEKVADLPRRLSTDGAPEGVDPEVGDITYFAPWGNLALFYRDFRYARGLVRLGRISGDVTALGGDRPLSARFERAGLPE